MLLELTPALVGTLLQSGEAHISVSVMVPILVESRGESTAPCDCLSYFTVQVTIEGDNSLMYLVDFYISRRFLMSYVKKLCQKNFYRFMCNFKAQYNSIYKNMRVRGE